MVYKKDAELFQQYMSVLEFRDYSRLVIQRVLKSGYPFRTATGSVSEVSCSRPSFAIDNS